jgi:phage shock protein C
MYCTKCGVELREADLFCSRCGARMAQWPVSEPPSVLRLDKKNKRIGGVCAGFARYFGVDVVLMRVLWLLIALATGVGFLVYFAAWIVIPSDEGYHSAQPALTPAPLVPQRR